MKKVIIFIGSIAFSLNAAEQNPTYPDLGNTYENTQPTPPPTEPPPPYVQQPYYFQQYPTAFQQPMVSYGFTMQPPPPTVPYGYQQPYYPQQMPMQSYMYQQPPTAPVTVPQQQRTFSKEDFVNPEEQECLDKLLELQKILEKSIETCRAVTDNKDKLQTWKSECHAFNTKHLPSNKQELEKILDAAKYLEYTNPLFLFLVSKKLVEPTPPPQPVKSSFFSRSKSVEKKEEKTYTVEDKDLEQWTQQAAQKYGLVLPHGEFAQKIWDEKIGLIPHKNTFDTLKGNKIVLDNLQQISYTLKEQNCVFLSLLSNIQKITMLNLTGLSLKNLPFPILQLTALKVLRLHTNELESLPELNKLSNLDVLVINANKFEEIPQHLTSLSQLKYLFARCNKLKTIPNFAGSQLSVLDFDNNQLEEFPDLPPTLEYLYLANNNIKEIPNERIEKLTKLKEFSIDENPLEYIPKTLFGIKSLEAVKLVRDRVTELKEVK